MDELLESLAELVRTLGRLHNNNKGLLLKGDIDRLEKAKDILHKNKNSDERGRLKPSDDASALPIPDVSNQRELLTAFAVFMVKNMAHGDTPAWLVEQFYQKGGQ